MILENTFQKIALVLIFSALTMVASQALAQGNEEEEVKSLGEILNPVPDFDENMPGLTPADFANQYYKECAAEESWVLDPEEKKYLCGCNSAKMSELLTVQEFRDLDLKGPVGNEARGKMLAYAYSPCMDHVIEKKVKHDCYVSKHLENIVNGKKLICKCSADRFKRFMSLNSPTIIMNAVHYDPMTIDPIEKYFADQNYFAQRDQFIKQCIYEVKYSFEN